jgi:putative hemolysin
MDLVTSLIVMLIFLVLKAFFSGSEIAIVNSDKLKLRHRAKKGDKGAALVLKMFRAPDVILGTTLVGTNVATVTITTMGTLIFINLFGEIGDLISVLVLTPFLLIFGEIVPKSIFQQKANAIVGYIVYGLRGASFLFYPVIFVFSRIARFAARLVGAPMKKNVFITREELSLLIDMSEAPSGAGKMDRSSIRRIIRFADTTVGQAMIPLADVVGFSESRSLSEAVQVVHREGFNRLPIFRGNLTNIKGVLTLSTWDLLDERIGEKSMSDYINPPLFLSPHQTIDQTLPLLQARKDHLGIVVDEFGSAIGIITMEDVFEEVVGDINVGYDFDEYKTPRQFFIEEIEDSVFNMSARTPISEVNDVLHIKLPVYEAHTIGGLVSHRLRRIPAVDDAITDEGFRFKVIEADAKAAIKVRAHRV